MSLREELARYLRGIDEAGNYANPDEAVRECSHNFKHAVVEEFHRLEARIDALEDKAETASVLVPGTVTLTA